MNPKAVLDLFKDSFKEWGEDKVPRLGAALAYYTIFSIGPLLLIAIAVAGLVFSGAQAQMVSTIQGMVGKEGADTIASAIKSASKPSSSIIATIIGLITLLFGASGVFGQLKDALNTIWEVKPKPGLGILAMLRERFLSFGMVLGTGFLLLVSLVVTAAVSALGSFLSSNLPGGEFLWQIINFAISILIVALMFALLFKFLPDAKIAWKDVWVGSIFTAVLFTLGQLGLGVYLGKGSVGSAYGAAGSIIIVLVWIYYSAQIMFFGAEFTQVYAKKYGSRVVPTENAEFATEEERAQQGMTRADEEKPGSSKKDKDQRSGKRRAGSLKASPWFR
ncbi:MAG: YihY/virulence factor BrkB family protein [Chloroflexota bacterium]|nr:YihY/virulence factor BrkB family protein [Chloroflexota bacterium]